MSQYFQVLGDERGATTGRGRSVGFLDIPWLQYVVRVTKPKYMALTRFDMLSGVKEIPVVVNYEFKGEIAMLGEGEWTVQTAKELGIDARVIEDSVNVRKESKDVKNQQKFSNKIVALLRKQFGGHSVK
jgi:adenylosuccinate synthase